MTPAELAAASDLIMPMAIRVAATLRIADLLADGPLTAEALATKAGANPEALHRLMRYLVARGLFEAAGTTEFALGESGRWLLDDAPGAARRWLDLEGFGGHMDRAFFELLGTVRAGGPVAAGNKLSLTPGAAASYDELMGERASSEGPALARVLDWRRFRHVVDVGGGTGAQLIALLTAFPGLRGTLVELPASIATARREFDAAGVSCGVLAGNLFDLELPQADVFVLRYLLHSFQDDQAVDALSKCRKALTAGGSILVMEASDAVPAVFAAMDLLMLVLGHGRERTLAEYDDAAAAAGLTRKAIHQPTAGPRVLEYVV
ncbi:methyltransferase [Streptomyces sp. SID13031]|uniref:methyltransferase n=1 Tax=Streptomyces sp. SID13031 TaxID=2706046 RepID=UPI0013C6DB9B|nr:methyltransferase [Streptomyces sp. SID13031]NEA34110.1 methyltransferase domain-containing protein [Streptomyces sp. SID13031]